MHGQPTTILALPDSRRHHRFTHQSWTSSLGHTFLYASKALDHEEVSLAYRSPRRSKDALLSLPWLDHPCCSSWLEPADQIIAVEGGASVVCIRSLSPEVDILGKAIHVEVISCPDTSQVLTAASERVYLQGAFPANVYACPDSRSQLAVWQTDLKTLQIFSLASLGVRASITLPEDTITCWGLPLRTRVAWKPDSSFISVAVVGHLDDHDLKRDSRRESPDVLEKLYICSTADSQVLHDLQLVGVIRGIHHVWNPVSQLLAFWGNIRGLACQQDEILFFETDTTLARSWVRPDGSSKHAICDCLQWSKNGVWLLAGLFLPECEHGDFQFPDWALDKPASASPHDAQMHLVDPNSGLSLQTFDMHAPDLFLIRGCSPSLSITSCPAANRLFDRRRRCIMTVQQETDGCWPRGLTCIVGPVLPVTRQAALSPCGKVLIDCVATGPGAAEAALTLASGHNGMGSLCHFDIATGHTHRVHAEVPRHGRQLCPAWLPYSPNKQIYALLTLNYRVLLADATQHMLLMDMSCSELSTAPSQQVSSLLALQSSPRKYDKWRKWSSLHEVSFSADAQHLLVSTKHEVIAIPFAEWRT